MSTLKVQSVQHASAASPAITLDANGQATLNGLAFPTSGSLSGRNRIINGDMRIDQRNAGASVAFAASVGGFPVDRFEVSNVTDGAWTGQRSTTAPTGFTNSLLMTVTTADTSLGATQFSAVAQKIEGFNAADLNWGTASAQPITLSFWIRSSLTGTFGGAFGNSAQSRSYPFTYTINSANTFEYKTVTVTGDISGTWLSDNGVGVRIYFGLGVGSTYSGTVGAWSGSFFISATGATSIVGTNGATFYITGVQLEAGTVATPFERRSYGAELSLCQRYCYVQDSAGATDFFMRFSTVAMGEATTSLSSIVYFPVRMRSAPSLTPSGSFQAYRGTFFIPSGLPVFASSGGGSYADSLCMTLPFSSGGITVGDCYHILAGNNNTARIVYSAEL